MTASEGLSSDQGAQRADRAPDGSRPRPLAGWLSEADRFTAVLSIVLVAFGISVLAGWALGLPLLRSWVPGLVQTKVNAALCFIGLGLGLSISANTPRRSLRWLRWGLALAVAAVAGITVFEQLAGRDVGIDQILFTDSASSPYPGRFAAQTGIALLCASLGVLTLGRRIRGVYVSELLALACGSIGAVSLLGYMYGASAILSLASTTQISLPGSACLIVIAAALIASDEHHVLVGLIADVGIGGQIMRRFLPAGLFVVPIGAWLRLMGERVGLYDESVGLAIVVSMEALVLVGIGAWTTVRVRRLEEERYEVLTDMMRLGSAASTPLIETAPVGLGVLDCDLRYLYLNPALAAINGLPALSSLGQRIDRLMPAFANEPQAALARVLQTGVAARDIEATGGPRDEDGSGTWLLSGEPIRDAEGVVIGLTISVVDITERKLREEDIAAVAELQRQAQAIGESIPFGIWVADHAGGMRYLSESFLEMTGLTMAEAGGSGWLDRLAPEIADQTRSDWIATVAARVPWNRELVIQDTNDSRHTILSRGFPIYGQSGQVTSWAGINLDLTDRRETEEFREEFLGILSHELGTPITSIYAASTLLQRPGLDEASRAELLDDIGQESERLRRLIGDLVVLARAERGTIQVHTEPVSLQYVLRKVCEQEQRRWPECTFKLTIANPMPVARAEEAFVEQIMRNLLDNAAKYGPSEGHIEVRVDAPDGSPRVLVLDRGPGIDPEEAERLFEVFYRSERTSRVAGSGIGLFVVRRLVESIGGTIWAAPRDDGEGAEFGFRLQPFDEAG